MPMQNLSIALSELQHLTSTTINLCGYEKINDDGVFSIANLTDSYLGR
jgi:hypothetical protein